MVVGSMIRPAFAQRVPVTLYLRCPANWAFAGSPSHGLEPFGRATRANLCGLSRSCDLMPRIARRSRRVLTSVVCLAVEQERALDSHELDPHVERGARRSACDVSAELRVDARLRLSASMEACRA